MADFELDRSFLNQAPGAKAPEPSNTRGAGARSYDRPFLLTGGRTESDLAFEALVWTTGSTVSSPTPEQMLILAATSEPVAVAEVAATAGIPIGVARVLIDDLVQLGALATGDIGGLDDDDDDDLEIVQRIISSLKAST